MERPLSVMSPSVCKLTQGHLNVTSVRVFEVLSCSWFLGPFPCMMKWDPRRVKRSLLRFPLADDGSASSPKPAPSKRREENTLATSPLLTSRGSRYDMVNVDA